MSRPTTDGTKQSSATVDRGPVARLVALRWKHALVALVVGMTTYALYGVGGWSIDTAVFGIATLAIIGYSVATYRSDVS